MAWLKLILLYQVFLLCFIMEGNAQLVAASALLKAKDVMSLSPSEIFTNPYALNYVWSDDPVPLEYYDDEAIAAQQMINESASDWIVTRKPDDTQKEWMDIEGEEITPYTWKWIDLEMNSTDNKIIISLRRPNWWLKQEGIINCGTEIFLNMPEMGAYGKATVIRIRPNQLDSRVSLNADESESIRPITGRFEHVSNSVYKLIFDSDQDSISVTNSHLFWSVDLDDWVSAGDLKVGECIKTHEGQLSLINRTLLANEHKVYNVEIFRDHTYYVSLNKNLVHNSCFKDFPVSSIIAKSEDITMTGGFVNNKWRTGIKPGSNEVIADIVGGYVNQMKSGTYNWLNDPQKITIMHFKDRDVIWNGHHRVLAAQIAKKEIPWTDSRVVEHIHLNKNASEFEGGKYKVEWSDVKWKP